VDNTSPGCTYNLCRDQKAGRIYDVADAQGCLTWENASLKQTEDEPESDDLAEIIQKALTHRNNT